MTEGRLARILDPSALDAEEGPCGRVRIELPAAWLETGAAFTLSAPLLLPCGRCDGGGCDSCRKSGAVRAPTEASSRVVQASVPACAPQAGVAIRIQEPFGASSEIRQLLIEVRPGEEASCGVCRLADEREPRLLSRVGLTVAAAGIALAVVVAVLLQH